MSTRSQLILWMAQRLSAVLLVLCVSVHLLTLIYAVRGGLTASEILARTRGSVAWGTFYTLFVLAVAVHAPIGLRTVCMEWLDWRGRSLDAVSFAIGLGCAMFGLRAVWAVVG